MTDLFIETSCFYAIKSCQVGVKNGIYNRESKQVINLLGMPNQEKYGLAAIRRIVNVLKKGGLIKNQGNRQS